MAEIPFAQFMQLPPKEQDAALSHMTEAERSKLLQESYSVQSPQAAPSAQPSIFGVPVSPTVMGGARTGTAMALPTVTSALGAKVGAGLGLAAGIATGGPAVPALMTSGMVAGEALGDLIGYLGNVTLGLEEFSLEQVGLSLTTPGASRLMISGGRTLIRGTKAYKFAMQEQLRDIGIALKRHYAWANDMLEANFPTSRADDLRENIKIFRRSAQDTERRFKTLAETRLGENVQRSRDLVKSFPQMDPAEIDDLYGQLRQVDVTLQATALKDAQAEVTRANALLEQTIPGLRDPRIARLAGPPPPPSPEAPVSLLFSPYPPHAPLELSTAATEKPPEATFQAVWETLKKLGQAASRLASSRDPAVREQRGALYQVKNSLEEILQTAETSGKLPPGVLETLRTANAGYARSRTIQELGDFFVQYTHVTRTGDEIFDARNALHALRTGKGRDVVLLRERLQKLDMLPQVQQSLEQMRAGVSEALRGAREARHLLQEAPAVADVPRFKKIEAPALAIPQIPFPEVTRPSLSVVFHAAFTGASLAAGVTAAAGAYQTTGSAYATAASFGAGFTAPYIISSMLTTDGGRRWLAKRLKDSDHIIDRRFAGAAGAFLRATISHGSSELTYRPPE